jgi:hypothetical protein
MSWDNVHYSLAPHTEPKPSRSVQNERIRSQNRNSSNGTVRGPCRTDLCKNIKKTGSLPCPFKDKKKKSAVRNKEEGYGLMDIDFCSKREEKVRFELTVGSTPNRENMYCSNRIGRKVDQHLIQYKVTDPIQIFTCL